MKFVSIATLLALAVATQATPLFDLPGIESPRVRTVTKVVYVTVDRDADKPTPPASSAPVASAPAKTTSVKATSSGDLSSEEPTESDTAAPPAETGTVVGSDNWITAMVCRVNAIRVARGAQPLGLSSEADAVAQQHSEYQNSIKQMTHSNPAGGVGARLAAKGVSWSTAAENVAAGMRTPEQAQEVLENSSGHLANMLNPSLTYMGAGSSNGYFTQIFYGESGNARALTVPKCN
ncbi:hypothetical protein GGI13_001288 [Coemansia sp. RSA 455]|nr:hypothetical protein LPJ71_002342 [Coemansia sp. S17]KAJ2020888.1 hypothetical protein GGI14_000484 [Coemansia sp. S680]KAJ2026675.1 hypothetical protein H4S03_008566 [Coemansia sp. S3946]KAJ2034376.1 hypothetical protein H4S04_009159 [Coemansia sp. S16]KAJ2038380.1 hypothetical protein GGI08_008340 [Coemansia sp. S2]KAJ2094955.1 hypothetical protein GGI09_005124 [Coemansia sp. S100]KAJ2256165.1 hypothetical protein GGI13_001288 [Coemansia sp. RSA 455]